MGFKGFINFYVSRLLFRLPIGFTVQLCCSVAAVCTVHKLLTIFVVCKFDVFFSKRARYVLNTASTLSSKGPTSLRWIWQLWPKNSTKLNGCGWLKVVLTLKITGSFWRYYNRNCDYFVFFYRIWMWLLSSQNVGSSTIISLLLSLRSLRYLTPTVYFQLALLTLRLRYLSEYPWDIHMTDFASSVSDENICHFIAYIMRWINT